MTESLAHSGGHLLVKHLQAVAGLAQRWAYLAGLWHDLGKYRPGFQRP